jgi:hypothetical protein
LALSTYAARVDFVFAALCAFQAKDTQSSNIGLDSMGRFMV